MKRNIILSFLLALLSVSAWAQQISEQQARERVQRFLSGNASAATRGLDVRSLQMQAAKVEAQSIYAFNLEGGGYVIASGDSRALPVLGYSDRGSIDWEHMPDNMRAWLKQYDQAMETLGKNKTFRDGNSIFAKGKTRADRAAIPPLVKTAWNQDEPYSDKCPLYDGADVTAVGKRCHTGCGATAMAQVMNYWQWPKASPELPAYDETTAYEGKEKIWTHPALPAVTFDWENMIEYYEKKNPETGKSEVVGTDAQKEAIATLMQYCGQSVEMEYSPDVSNTYNYYVAEALAKFFCYDGGLRLEHRVKYTIDEWEALVYGELSEGRPVVYGGYTDTSGHSFVCDGYDGAGLYHINWGWSGNNNGYFSLSLLNPYDNESLGSSSSPIGYCIDQEMVAGIKPAPEGTAPTIIQPDVFFIENFPFEIKDGTDKARIPLGINVHKQQVVFDYGLGTMAADGTLTPLFTSRYDNFITTSSLWSLYVVIDKSNPVFADGQTVKLYPIYKLSGGEWKLLGSIYNYMYVSLREDGLFSSTHIPDITVSDVKVTFGTGRAGLSSEFTLTVTNNDSIDFCHKLSLIAGYLGHIDPSEVTDDTPVSWGELLSDVGAAYIRAGETGQATFSFKPVDTGLQVIFLFSANEGNLADFFYETNDTIGCYDDFVRNDSYLDVDYVYTRDYQQASYSEGDGLRPGHYTWHVCFTDNNAAGHPYGRPADNIYALGSLRDKRIDQINKVTLTDEAFDYLKQLPDKGGNGDWKLEFDVDLDIRLGGVYTTRAYFCEDLDESGDKYIMSSWYGYDFTVSDDPGIHVVGDTILASGQKLNLELELNTGYPYDPRQFTGQEQARATLYLVNVDGTLTEQKAVKWPLGFDSSNPYKALTSTYALNDGLADGHYLLRIESDLAPLSSRDVNLYIGTTGIEANSQAPTAKSQYYNLQGHRHDVRPSRKGIYVRNGSKVVIK